MFLHIEKGETKANDRYERCLPSESKIIVN